jgi:hypothetical protein
MRAPEEIPGFKVYMVLVGLYALLWIALEGNLVRVTVLGCAVTLWLMAAVLRRWITRRQFGLASWIAVCGALGTIGGFLSAMLTLLFMALKTGLHAHGPEFSPAQIAWVLRQAPWWTSAGLLAGMGLAMIVFVLNRES